MVAITKRKNGINGVDEVVMILLVVVMTISFDTFMV